MNPRALGRSGLPLVLSALVSAAWLGGCGPKDEEDAPLPKAPEFAGKVDPALAGTWRAEGGVSVLTMKPDGGLQIESSMSSVNGKLTTKRDGKWLVDGDRLLMRYRIENGTEQTVGYAMKRAGETLTLSTKVPKLSTVYRRAKA